MADTLFNYQNGFNQYVNDPKIKKMLQGHTLLPHKQFIEWFRPQSPKELPVRSTTKNRLANTIRTVKETNIIAKGVLSTMANNVCENEIGKGYGIDAIHQIANDLKGAKEKTFDILVSVIPGYDNIKNTTSTKTLENKKLKCITGFIIVQKGECRKLKDVYSVYLICTRGRGKVIGNTKNGDPIYEFNTKSGLLLGAYLYCIKCSPLIKNENKLGILELASAYMNMSGFFAYTKVGFDKDNSLFDTKPRVCFEDANNLPMSVNLNLYTLEDIIDMVTGHKKRDNVNDDTGIIQLGLQDSIVGQIVQRNLGILNTMKQYIILTKRDYPYYKGYSKLIDYKNEVVPESDVNDKIRILDKYISDEKNKLNTNIVVPSIIPPPPLPPPPTTTSASSNKKNHTNKRNRTHSSKSRSPSPNTKTKCENNRKTRRNSRSPSPIGCSIAGGK